MGKKTAIDYVKVERSRGRIRVVADIPTERRAFRAWVRATIGDVSAAYIETLRANILANAKRAAKL